MPYSTKKRPFHLTTPLNEDVLLLHRFDGEEALSRPFEFRLSLLSEDDAIDAKDLVSKRLTLWANDDTDGDEDGGKCWSGIVASFGRSGSQWCTVEGDTQELTTYEAVIVPWFWQLKLVEDCRIFQNQSIPDIVDTILGELQLGKHETDLSGRYDPLDYCVQYGESSFDFIARLLEDAGIHYFFKHDPDEVADVLVISDHQEKDYKGQVKNLRFAANWTEQDEPVVFALARSQRMRTGRVMMRDFDFTKPTQNLEAGVDTMLTVGAEKAFQSYRYPGGYLDRGAGDARAKLAMEIEEAAHELLDGASTMLTIGPGVAFELGDAPNDVLEPAWRVLRAHHRGENNFDDDSGDSYYRNDFTVMPLALPYRPSRDTHKPRMRGPQTAIVTGPAGEEIYTDQHGRVKVHFFWDHLGKSDDKSSCWIRVSQTWAGRGWGTFFLPRIGMEVIVDFIDGDPDHPLITGCVYNGDNTPPYDPKKHGTVSTIKGYSSKGGHGFNELRFEDKKSSEQLMMHAQNRMDVCVNGNFCERNGGERDLRVGKDFDLWVKGNVSWTTEEGWYEEVRKDNDLTIKGNIQRDFQSNLSEKVAKQIEINSKNYSLVVQEEINVKSDTLTAEVAANLKIRGGTIVLEGSDGGITLKCGASFITMMADGITIQGPLVKINSGGSAQGGSPAQPAGALDMLEPQEPLACDCGEPGTGCGGGGSGGSGGGGHSSSGRAWKRKGVSPLNPPNWKPPKPPTPIPLPVVPPISERPCGIKDLDLVCGHAPPRHPDASRRILQIVPNTGATSTSVSYSVKSIETEFSGAKKSGGTDTIKLSGTAVDGSTGPIHTAVSRTPSPPADADFKGGAKLDTTIQPPASDSWWPYPFKPDVYCFYGKGCDDNQLSWTVEVYPSIEYSGSITVKKFESLFKKVFSTDEKNGITLSLTFTGPSGSIELSWGWSENSDWRSYFFAKAKASVTFASADGKATINLKEWATAGALAFAGVPLNDTLEIYDYLDSFKLGDTSIMDIFSAMTLALGLKASVGLECDIQRKFFADGTQETGPSAALKGTAALHADLIFRGGPVDVVNVILSGTGEAPFELTGNFSIEADGFHLKPSLDFKGLTIKVDVEFNLMKTKVKKGLLDWRVMDPRHLWPDPSDPTPPDWHFNPL